MSAYISKSASTELCSPSAMVQWAELPSAFSLSMMLSPVASSVAGSCTWSDMLGSSSGVIPSTVAPCGDGSSFVAGSGSPSVVGSGSCSTQRGDGGLGSGSSCVTNRGKTLSRHRTIASLKFNPAVSGRSTGQWQFAPILNRHFSASLSKVVVAARRLKSRAKLHRSWILRASSLNFTASSINKKQKLYKTKNKTRGNTPRYFHF